MADLGQTFDDTSPTMGGGGFPLSEGEHPFIVISEEIKEVNGKPQNKYLQYNCVVDEGPQKGDDFAIRLNLWNDNPMAVKISSAEFNTMRIAMYVPGTNDSTALVQKRAIAIVTKKSKGKNAGEIYISDYAPVAGAQPAAATPATTAPATTAAPETTAPATTAAPETTAPATTAPATTAQAAAPWK